MTSRSCVAALFGFNTRLSDWTRRRFVLRRAKLAGDFGEDRFDESVANALNGLPSNSVVVDVGGGRRCVYARIVPRDRGVRVVAVDISADELAENDDVDEIRVGDIAKFLPFRDEEVDLVTSRYVLEHVSDVPAAVQNIHTVLKRGGTTMHLCPCRYSLFGIAAKIMPFKILKDVLHSAAPQTAGEIAFDVHYDKCYPSVMRRVFLDAGFHDVQVDVFWSQDDYFDAVFPLFLLVCCYEWLMRVLNIRVLAAYMVIEARK